LEAQKPAKRKGMVLIYKALKNLLEPLPYVTLLLLSWFTNLSLKMTELLPSFSCKTQDNPTANMIEWIGFREHLQDGKIYGFL